MNQSQFFNALRNKLSSDFSNDEVNQIIEFYTMRFRNGLEQGRSEKELIAEFGNPNQIVHALQPKKFYPKDPFIYLALFLIGLLPFLDFIFQISTMNGYTQTFVYFSYIYAAVAPILVCIVPHFIKKKPYIIPKKRKKPCFIFQIVSILTVVLVLAFCFNLVMYTMLDSGEVTILDHICKFILYDLLHGQVHLVVPFLKPILMLSILLLTTAWFIALFYEKDSFNSLSFGAFLASGLLQTVSLYTSLLFTLDSSEAFMVLFPRCWIPFAISLIVGILFFLGSYMRPKINTKHHSPIPSIQ